ncbi:hypothetical protein DICPUDRAFT_89641 [Dictyostelium purpureum]|uniref:RNI-like protein n=1 Tax=Dictyostelium purpureum TaxID=5786 RepID=F0ZX71_DICPU|nr:uncharacterized protein DICPUDRAFT_89641 [Dictyostelium purpureum]EGC31446.1 hypothetical protein DICPUDRAFT_89641 [Dictyostelium purpureum]|eukprot:XP_003292015.1 hypothetical protein DICPUDRAFT_89641 [Dictyostelium purpureum]
MPPEREIQTLKQLCFQYLLRNHEKIPGKKVAQIYEISDIREEFIGMAKRKNLVDDHFFNIFGDIFIISNLFHSNSGFNNNINNNNSFNSGSENDDSMDLDTASSTTTGSTISSNISNDNNTINNIEKEIDINNDITSNINNINNNNNNNLIINNNNNNLINNSLPTIPRKISNHTNIDLSNIQSIDLSGLLRITDLSVHLISGYKHLKHLNLSFCTGISADFIKHLNKSIPLESLNLYFTNINDTTLQTITTTFPGLKRLLIGGCNLITETGIKSLLKMTSLTHLDVSHCRKLTNSAMKLISFPTLIYLNCSWCFDLQSGDGCYSKIAKNCPKLQTLHIASSAIGEAQLIKILSEAKRLTTLDISHCTNAISTLDSKVFKYLGNIQNLLIAGCQFKEPIIRKILDSSPNLKELDLSHQDSLTWSLIESILKDDALIKRLKVLNFSFSKFDKFEPDQLSKIDSLTVFLPSL